MHTQLIAPDQLSEAQKASLKRLSDAVYPPEFLATWPGKAVDWQPCPWRVVVEDESGDMLSHVGFTFGEALADGKPLQLGGIGGVKTLPSARKRGLASACVLEALAAMSQDGVDAILLVCDPERVPWYESLGFERFGGEFCVQQGGASVPFTFNLPMLNPLGQDLPHPQRLELLGKPW